MNCGVCQANVVGRHRFTGLRLQLPPDFESPVIIVEGPLRVAEPGVEETDII